MSGIHVCARRHLVVCALALLSSQIVYSTTAAAAPMSRDEFTKIVARGVPRSDVVAALGAPTRVTLKKEQGLTELFYENLVLNPKNQAIENVTINIFNEYDVVDSIRWADGSVSE
jgi:hypothetical protein